MYDRRLDAILAAGELGSFGKAAEMLHISTPALAKQVNAFEREHGLVLFDRSRTGVRYTDAGESLARGARDIKSPCEAAMQRARSAMRDAQKDAPVRLGMSVLRSSRTVLDLWQRSGGFARPDGGKSLRLELVALNDDFDAFDYAARHLGQDVDVLACAFAPHWWDGVCAIP